MGRSASVGGWVRRHQWVAQVGFVVVGIDVVWWVWWVWAWLIFFFFFVVSCGGGGGVGCGCVCGCGYGSNGYA